MSPEEYRRAVKGENTERATTGLSLAAFDAKNICSCVEFEFEFVLDQKADKSNS